jgi:hypothetical protein
MHKEAIKDKDSGSDANRSAPERDLLATSF